MAAEIQRGSCCRLKFAIMNDVDLDDLGQPDVAIAQDIAYISPENDQITVDKANRCVYVDLTEDDTMALAENTATRCQLVFANSDTNQVIRFPIHNLTVASTLLDNIL